MHFPPKEQSKYFKIALNQNLSASELSELRDNIEEVISTRRYKKVLNSTNTKAVTTTWVIVAVLISLYRYLTM